MTVSPLASGEEGNIGGRVGGMRQMEGAVAGMGDRGVEGGDKRRGRVLGSSQPGHILA